ncbi:hypothetical protein C8N24_0278 [Solirubrobacter pauli]|uniref:Uncharacterized protein n=1 Tax=Solirubrobacter pauli TaxID=166793 RepID=A0A660LBS4_9ACTN|nr:hypothetical protein C8N24_0278 [Solirubrobacter pauli]
MASDSNTKLDSDTKVDTNACAVIRGLDGLR